MFESTVLDALGLVIVGGPARICVLQVFQRQRLWYSIPAQVRISGYAAGDGVLYIQDGPVLSAWSLTEVDNGQGVRYAAFNLATGVSRSSDGNLAAADLAAVYALDAGLTARQQDLARAQNAVAWTELIPTLDWMTATWHDAVGPAQLWPAALPPVYDLIIEVLTGTAPDAAPLPDLVSATLTRLTAEQNQPGSLAYSPPVARAHQVGSAVTGGVFVLSGDGTLHALDGGLSRCSVTKFAAPATPQLALLEESAPNDPTSYLCRLYYRATDGSIVELDGVPTPVAAAGAWPAQGTAAAQPLPLTGQDDLIWGGGVIGSDFFALPSDPPAPPVISVPNAGAPWTAYAVDPVDQLALVTSGDLVRLTAYATSAHVRDRWGVVTAPGQTVFWPASETGGPTLVLNVDEQTGETGGNVGFRVLVANTVDAANLTYASTYPPPPPVLAAGTLDPGSLPGAAPRVAWIRTEPLIARDTAYVIAQPTSPFDAITDWLTPDDSSGNPVAPMDTFTDHWKSTYPDGVDPGDLTLPALCTGADELVAFALPGLAATVVPAATAEIARLTAFAGGIQVATSWTFAWPNGPSETITAQVATFQLVFADSELLPVVTDANGLFSLDSKYDGQTATMAFGVTGAYLQFIDGTGSPYNIDLTSWGSEPVTLHVGTTAQLAITIHCPNPTTPSTGEGAK